MIFYFVVIGDNAVWDFGLSPDLPKSRLGSDPTSANNAMYTSSPPAPTFGVQTSNPGTLLWLEEHRGPGLSIDMSLKKRARNFFVGN